jgi:2-(1,2-epoxy-1,2-dihydrophenyl)acetyl-CoA isomerase
MSDNTVVVDKQDDGIAYIILNKPKRRNAIDAMMMDCLVSSLVELDGDADVKIIILKGEGDHFCSGGDLKAGPETGYTIEESRASLRKYCKAVQTIQEIEKPVIAQVRGYAVGGGMSLALACDLIFASESAKFSSNFLHVGIIPEMGAMLLMPLAIGLYRAKELWFTARVVGANEAREMGFVNRVFTDEEIDRATQAFAVETAKVPALSLRITKRITNSIMLTMLNTVLDAESQASPFCSQTKEHKELISAFVNKKK